MLRVVETGGFAYVPGHVHCVVSVGRGRPHIVHAHHIELPLDPRPLFAIGQHMALCVGQCVSTSLAYPGLSWHLRACPGISWHVVAYPGIALHLLAYHGIPGISGHLPASPGISRHILPARGIAQTSICIPWHALRLFMAGPILFSCVVQQGGGRIIGPRLGFAGVT